MMMEKQVASAGFWIQTNALFRKNLTFQMRNKGSNLRLVSFPILMFLLLKLFENSYDRNEYDVDEPEVLRVPPLLTIPSPEFRAVKNSFFPFDLPEESCRSTLSCPASILFTGNNKSFVEGLTANMFGSFPVIGHEIIMDTLIESMKKDEVDHLYNVQRKRCSKNYRHNVSFPLSAVNKTDIKTIEMRCVRCREFWRPTSLEIKDELYKGHWQGNPMNMTNEIVGAYDLFDSSGNKFNVNIWYNATQNIFGPGSFIPEMHVLRFQNMVSNAYLQSLLGNSTKMQLEYVKSMPKHRTIFVHDYVTSYLGLMVFTWAIMQLFPVILISLVYEKQQKLRIIMKMHGLGDGPYMLISYFYHLIISSIYMYFFVQCGYLVGVRLFTLNALDVQFVFYFIYINLQIAIAFLVATIFSSVKTCTVIAYMIVFGTGLLGQFLFKGFLIDRYFPRSWCFVMELYPGFALYRGLYELQDFSMNGATAGTRGMHWAHLKNRNNGMREGDLFLSPKLPKKHSFARASNNAPIFQRQRSKILVRMDKPDVAHEREKVEQMDSHRRASLAMISDNLKKVHPGRDGNPENYAVKGLSLVVSKGECFGLLGPNGAGKTTFINMMIGLTKPSYGTAYVQGLDIRTQMNRIYTNMGVCSQQDLLWETLSGRDHLLFYGRLKNLRGSNLIQAVEESLQSINLLRGGFADKPVSKYSGGMKRRLSVAISLIGDTKVVYMDEPSTGLDPGSRNQLWKVINQAKKDRAIILTTHSMEEAEELCDRLGIFVDGELRCLGNPNVLKARYEGTCVLTITTSTRHNEEVENMVRGLCPSYKKSYHLSGTQKFEMPKHKVRLSEVFKAVEKAKTMFTIQAWGISDTTLEDVFIKVARESHVSNAPTV